MRRLVGLVAGGLTVAALAVGCGGDSDASGDDRRSGPSAAVEPPEVFARRLARLLATSKRDGDCRDIRVINGRSYARFQCPADRELAASMKRFKVAGAEAHWTGAVVDYRSGKARDGASILLFVGPGRQWGVSRFGLIAGSTVGTSDAKVRSRYRRAVERYVEVVRERDCAGYRELVYRADGFRGESCRAVLARSAREARAFKRNPGLEPVYAGGNGTFGFFNLEMSKPSPENLTLSVMRAASDDGDRIVVLDVAPSPTTAEIKRDIRRKDAERRRKSKSMMPSESDATGRKAD